MATARLLLAALIAAMLTTSAVAQSASIPDDRADQLADAIIERARALNADLATLGERLTALPDDLEGAEAVYDEMIAEADAVVQSFGDDTPIGRGVRELETWALRYRDEWRARCERTSNSRDCARIALWETRVQDAIDVTARYERTVDTFADTLATLRANKVYVVDDMRLQLFDAVRTSLAESLDDLDQMAQSMQALAGDVRGERVGN